MESNIKQLELSKKAAILEQASKIFMRYGLKSVTMDDVSRELKISKKTLYRFVSDKNDLVEQVMQAYIDQDKCCIDDLVKQSKNAIEEILLIGEHVGNTVKDIHPSIHYDMEKYYNEAWNVFHKHKRGYIFKCITDNLMRGIKEGYYRKDLNVPVIAKIYVSRADMVFDGELFPPEEIDFRSVYLEMMNYHLRGIASEKGIKLLHDIYKK